MRPEAGYFSRREFIAGVVGLGLETVFAKNKKPEVQAQTPVCTSYALGKGTPVAVPAGTCKEGWIYCCDKSGNWVPKEQSGNGETRSQTSDLHINSYSQNSGSANEPQTYQEFVSEMRAMRDGIIGFGTAVTIAGGAIYLLRRFWNRTLGNSEWRKR